MPAERGPFRRGHQPGRANAGSPGAPGPGAKRQGGAEVVLAAGGALWRRAEDGELEVLLVHRPRYDDWSLPKGKLGPDEAASTAALREVAEETGIRCSLGPELPTVRYLDSRGADKVVRYWAMRPQADLGFEPGEEVDELAWLPLGAAAETLTYSHDRPVLLALAESVDRLDGSVC